MTVITNAVIVAVNEFICDLRSFFPNIKITTACKNIKMGVILEKYFDK